MYQPMINQTRRRSRAADRDAGASRNQFQDAVTGFDPSAYLRESAEGQFNQFRGQLNEDMADLRGSQVGLGRLNTGFATEDEDRMVRTGMDRLNNQLMGNAMQAGGMEQRRQGMMGDMYRADRGRADNLYGMQTDLGVSQGQQRLQDRASRRGMWGNIVGGLAGAAGTVLGGPIGGALAGGLTRSLVGGGAPAGPVNTATLGNARKRWGG